VHADDERGALGGGGDPRDGNRRGVRREDHAGLADLVELLEDPELEVFSLRGRLDDEVRILHVLEVRALLDPAEDLLLLVLLDLVLGDQPVEVLGDRVVPLVDELVGDVVHDDVDPARVCRDLGDPVAHLTSPYDADCLDCHLTTLLVRICCSR